MQNSEIINRIMYDWESLSQQEMQTCIQALSRKLLRWLGEHHPDNKTRKLFFKATNVVLAESCVINRGFVVSDDYEQLLTIEDRVAISPNVTVICVSNPNNSSLKDNAVCDTLILKGKVCVEQDAWIGANTVLLPGITIGRSSIVGAGAVVVSDVEPFSIYAGVPARKKRFFLQPE